MKFGGKIVAVTGGARGIGEATVRLFAEQGARLAVLDTDERAARATAASIEADGGLPVWVHECDVADEASVKKAFRQLEREFGPVNVLVNNAGINPRMDPLDVTLDVWSRVLATNLTGCFLCSRAAGMQMVRNGGGAIVNVTSIAASSALGRGNFAFSVAKAGVEAATRELAVEWARSGVRVNSVAPCQVSTASFASAAVRLWESGDPRSTDYASGIPMGRTAEARDVASAIVYLASDDAAMITGISLAVDGGNLALNAGGSIGLSKENGRVDR